MNKEGEINMKINPIDLEIFKNKFSSIAEEMGIVLQRTSYSPNIKERRDFSCAIFDKDGDMIAQALHIPVHLGSMSVAVKSAISGIEMEDGDMIVLNDPFRGGTHLPDITFVAPVFFEKRPCFFVANRAHHADIGGISAGSMPISNSIFQEGLIIPPVKLLKRGKIDNSIMQLILRNVRTPDERMGDFEAQIMANMVGVKRLKEFISEQSLRKVITYGNAIIDYAERLMREIIRDIPDGTYEFEDFLDDDGMGNERIRIHCSIRIKGDEAEIDLSRSNPQTNGCVNAVYGIALSAILYVFRCLVDEDIPANSGCLRPIRIITKKGTIVDATFPSAVSGGNVETSQRIVDTVLGALSKALPNKIPAASQGTMNNISIGGIDPRNNKPFAYYETIAGGMGASAKGKGEDAIHCHMTNTMNTPIEALEYAYPLMIKEYSIRRGSGGKGKHRGGDGVIREMMLLSDAEVTVMADRRKIPPYGLYGGMPGARGRNIIVKNGKRMEYMGKFSLLLKKGDVIRIESPGGGGWGSHDNSMDETC